jgi:hypothetical protein
VEYSSLLFHPSQFAVAFDAANGNAGSAPKTPESVMWLEGGIGVAGRGFAWGQGLSVEDADAVCIYAIGRVTYLSRIADFDGFYLASGARSSTAGGGHATHLRNERGVQIELVATDAARATSRSIEALCVRLKRKMASRAA